MHFVRSLITVIGSLILLLALQAGVIAQAGLARPAPHAPQADTPLFIQLLTVTVETGDPTAAALFSRWDNTYLGFPVGPGGLSFPMPTPADSTAITASVEHGSFEIVGNTVYFTLTESSDFYWSYRTAQKVLRTGNQFQIDQFARINNFYRYIGTIFYPPPYQYVGSINFAPQLVTSDTLHWDLIVPQNVPPDRHMFNASSWLVDPRLDQPDLSIIAASLSIESGLNPPIAQLTATVRNNNDVDITSTAAFLEFYDRPSPSAPPVGPLDHDGGWCGSGAVPVCPAFATFTNPIPSLAPGASATVFMTHPLQLPGLRDFYFQIDTFGGVNGLNVEYNELNNVYTLTRGVAIDYLASVAISGPVTGTAHTLHGFDAQISPTLAVNRPLTYTWLPDPVSGQGTAHAAYAWDDGFLHTITVSATNVQHTVVTDTHLIALEVPLSSALISGPVTVSQNIPHAYQASAQPITATQPVDYVWDPEPDQGQHTETATYTLASLGPYILQVYARNPIGPAVTATHTVVSLPPLTAVAIEGLTGGHLNATYVFTATIEPADAAPPFIYQWSPSPDSGQGTPQAAYHWTTTGAHDVHLTVGNDSGEVTRTHTILIGAPLTGASIAGPITVSQNSPHAYSVSVQPVAATLPINYVWNPEPDQGQATAVATYTLANLGASTLRVYVSDPIGPALAITHTVNVVPPLTAVAIEGPATGRLRVALTFTATVDPADAASPIDYQWSPSPVSGQGTHQGTYQWTTPGTHVISVTAQNDSGPVGIQHLVDITGAFLYLPLIRK